MTTLARKTLGKRVKGNWYFHVAALCQVLTKERAIPQTDFARAKARNATFEQEPATHTASYRFKSD